MLFYVLFIGLLSLSCGFLLETNIPKNISVGQTGPSSRYLTLSEFFDYKKQREHDSTEMRHVTDQLRVETDKTLALLTSQIQQKFSLMEQKLQDNCQRNESKSTSDKLDKYYKELEKNNTRLQHDLDKLMTKYTLQENELVLLKDEQLLLKNKTMELEAKTAKTEQLKTINQLQDLQNVKQQLQSISTQTNILTLNERARSQDFLALYNETIGTKNNLHNLDINTKSRINQLEMNHNFNLTNLYNQFKEFKKSESATVENLNETLTDNDRRIQMVDWSIRVLEQRFNATTSDIKKQVGMVSEKVTMTACLPGDPTYNAGDVVKFNSVKVQVGISDVSSFTSSGKFKCEKPGLYLVSVWILSNTKNSRFDLYKNGNFLFNTFSPNNYDRSTVVAAVELAVNDTVWVKAVSSQLEVDSWGSCMTVTKIH